MNYQRQLLVLLLLGFISFQSFAGPQDEATDKAKAEREARIKELDRYWAEVSKSVREGNFEGYQATCHQDGVLVSGRAQTSYPLTQALARWRSGFNETQSGKIQAEVRFRFRQRLNDVTTAHETGIFRYSTAKASGEKSVTFIHFEALLLKQDRWRILMEYQKSEATKAEWDQLK